MKKISMGAIGEFTDTLSLLLNSGLSLKDSLEVGKDLFTQKRFFFVSDVYAMLKQGKTFSEAISLFGDSFPPVYKGLISVGERSGQFEKVFDQLAKYLKDAKKIREKMISSLIYPSLLLFLAVGGILFFVLKGIPMLTSKFESMGSSLPPELLTSFDNVQKTAGVFVVFIILAIVSVLGVRFFIHFSSSFALKVDSLLLRIPLISPILKMSESLNFVFAMETLCSCGVPLEEGLFKASTVIKNRQYQWWILESKEKIVKGVLLSKALDENRGFPQIMVRWISIGERSGNIEPVFHQLRDYYQEKLDNLMVRAMAIFEPMIIIGIGLIVFYIVAKILLPFMSIYGNVG